MKKYIFILIAISTILSFSCSGLLTTNSSSDSFSSEQVATSLSNDEDGLTNEMNDLNGIVTDSSKGRNTIVITTNGSLTGFTWDSTNEYYKRTGASLDVSSDYYTGSISSITITVQLLDATGDAVQLGTSDKVGTDVKSIEYSRTYTATLTNSSGVQRTVTNTTTLTMTGINDGTEGVKLTGTRTSTVTYTNGTKTGTWTIEYTFNDLDAKRTYSGGTYYTEFSGTINASIKGTYTGALKTITIDKSGTITFSWGRSVTVKMGDSGSVTVNIETGVIVS